MCDPNACDPMWALSGAGKTTLGFLLASQGHRHPLSQPPPLFPGPCLPAHSCLTWTEACLHLLLPCTPSSPALSAAPWSHLGCPKAPSCPRTLCHPSRPHHRDLATRRHRCPSLHLPPTFQGLLIAVPAQPPLTNPSHTSCSGPGRRCGWWESLTRCGLACLPALLSPPRQHTRSA